MTLLAWLLDILAEWRAVFPQLRCWRWAACHALGSLVCLGRRTLSRILWTNGDEQQSGASITFCLRAPPWEPQGLFAAPRGSGL